MQKQKIKDLTVLLLGSAVLAFGMYNIHSISNVTEGGALGLTLLFEHWLYISPALSGAILNVICYFFGIKVLGKQFLIKSAIAAGGFSGFYALFECFDRVYPNISDMPLLASILGGMFVGVGVGMCIRVGGAPSGDDALALALAKLTKLSIRWVYLFFDIIVLALSLSYIPLGKIVYSLLTVVISGQIVGFFENKNG